jgi:serine/threonine protein kinase
VYTQSSCSIGAGAMGEVYRAKDTGLGRDLAIKLVNESE